MQQLLGLCSCPRADNETLSKPRCAVLSCIDGSSTVLFVQAPQGLFCKAAMQYGNSTICNCVQRLALYKTSGV